MGTRLVNPMQLTGAFVQTESVGLAANRNRDAFTIQLEATGSPAADLQSRSMKSDCQGQTSSPLIVWRSFLWQSAPTFLRARASGYAGQSPSASFTSIQLLIRLDECKRRVRAMRTTVPSETRHGAGLTLLLVLRGDLELGECLGVTAGRADGSVETAPRTVVLDPGAVDEVNSPAPAPLGPRTIVASTASHRSTLLSSTGAA